MKIEKGSDGYYHAQVGDSREEILSFSKYIQEVAHLGVGADFNLIYKDMSYSFGSPRELFFFASALESAMKSQFITCMEEHVSNIVDSVYNLSSIELIEIEDVEDERGATQ